MTFTSIAAGAALCVLALATPALAQNRGTPEQQQACTPDAMTLCGEFIPDPGRVRACLLGRRANLSPACRAAIAPSLPERAPRKRRRAR
ncbi:hypothetical protein [Methylobacterium sp. JK268]